MPFLLPSFRDKIKRSNFAEDYELDDGTVRKIEKLFQDYTSTRGWDSEARADAGRHAKREIEALAKTLNKLPEQWQAAFSSHYLQQHIINAYCGRNEITSPPDEASQRRIAELVGCMNKLDSITAEFQRLKDAVNAVKSMESWDSYAFRQFDSGRPRDTAKNNLIRGLDALAGRLRFRDKNDFVRRAVEFVGLRYEPQRTPGARTRKTLRNKRSMSRK